MSPSSTAVRVLIADDHPLYREGIVRTLQEHDGIEVVADCADGRGALERLRSLRPDVAVLDVKMPGLDGTDVLSAVVEEGLPTRILFLSAFLDSAVVYDVIAAGAAGYLSKEAGKQEIADAVLAVARGEAILPPQAQTAIAGEIRVRRADPPPALSARETEVLSLAAEGCSAPEIASRLGLTTATVKTHLRRSYDKLGVSERAAAVAAAMRHGVLQ